MKSETVAISTEKLNGQFYTPKFIVDNILDLSGYHGQIILKKHAIDNSCGDGAFLVEIVNRYCKEYLQQSNDLQNLKTELSTFIHGIEINEIECEKCIKNLNRVVSQFGISNVIWDIFSADTLTVDKYNGKMDFVLGNPPYVRVHNLGSSSQEIKKFTFSRNGMTDLYIVFYEIGLKMLNENGVLGYITPSSYFNSLAGKYMRSYFVDNNLIDKVVDLKHYQVFSATTYTTITILKKNRVDDTCDYYQFEDTNNFPYYVNTLKAKDYYICGNFYFANKDKLTQLKDILYYHSRKEMFSVKNGFATLADSFFIGSFDFDDFTIPVVKASTGRKYQCLFPYKSGKLVPYEDLISNMHIKYYFETHKDILSSRSLEHNGDWYGFGRSQGINDVSKIKYAINTLIRDIDDLKLVKCEKGVGVYSGLYILTDLDESILRDMLYNENFISYISMLGKYKSGGYYTFSSKELKNYLEYKFSQRNGFNNE